MEKMFPKISDDVSQGGVLLGQSHVDEDEDIPPGSAAVRRMMTGGELETIERWLLTKYPDARADIEDAVVDAVVRFLATRAKGKEIDEPAAWVRTTARNRVLNILERRISRENTYNDVDDLTEIRTEPTIEDTDAFRYLRELVERWPSGRMRVVTLLYLEAGYEQEPLSQQDAAEMASLILDEDVPWTAIGKTRQRGLDRLRAEILSIASQTGINPLTGEDTA